MPQPYIGEIRIFAGNFAPAGWMFCNGSLVSISENETLFTLIGTTYGGDGQSTFALPDLRGRLPLHMGSQNVLATTGGTETVTLTTNQIPAHTHPALAASAAASDPNPVGTVPAEQVAVSAYSTGAATATMATAAIPNAGGSQPHENLQPGLCLSFVISLFGIFPSPS